MGDFERKVFADLPRGTGGEDRPSEARWFKPENLGQGWNYRDDKGRAAGVYLGCWDGKELGRIDDRHIVTVAGARAGKGASLIVPNLLRYEGSVIAVDPKGELAKETSQHRREKLKQRVVILDPFGVSGDVEGCGWNPLDQIDLTRREAVDDALAIAEAMIQIPDYGERHWSEAAQAVVQALVLCAKLMDDEDDRNLCTVHDLLMLNHRCIDEAETRSKLPRVQALFRAMESLGDKAEGMNKDVVAVIEGVANTYITMADKERESVLSSARTQTRFLKSPSLRAVLGKSSLRLSEIKRDPKKTTLYLCLPAGRMGSHAKWLRIVVSMALQSFEDNFKPDIPVLVVLDEFAVLGQMASIETGAAFLPGFGVKLWTVLQDLGQLKKLYSHGWETFVGNAGVMTFFANTDQTTLEYISRQLGNRTMVVKEPSNATHDARFQGAPDMRLALRVDPLLAPTELANYFGRSKMRVLVLAAEELPVVLKRVPYHP